MFSPSEGPQQSAPTAVTLSAAAPAAEAMTGTCVSPAVSSKGVAEASASSAGAALVAVPAAAPATGGTVLPTASVGGAARASASADGIAALTATGGTVVFAASVGGAPASSAVAAASAEISAAEPATSGMFPRLHQLERQSGRASHPLERCHWTRQRRRHRRPAVLLPLLRRRRGRPERSRQQLGPLEKSAARGRHPPTPSIPIPCFRWRSATAATSEPDITAAAAAAAAALATTIPTTTTHGGMQPVLEHCCNPLIRGSDAGGVRGEGRQFLVWISLLTAGKHGGEYSMEGDGLRAKGEFLAFIWLVSRTTEESRVGNCVGFLP